MDNGRDTPCRLKREDTHTVTLLRTRVISAIVVTLVAAVAMLVYRSEPEASWLRVDAPSAIAIGEQYIATVILLEPADSAFLGFDLHGEDARKNPLGFVVAGKTQTVADGHPAFTITLVLRDRPDVARVHAVIYLSRSGQWRDAFRVVRSESLDVIRSAPRAANIFVRPLSVHDQKESPAIEVANPPLLSAVIAALWLGAAAVAAAASGRPARGAAEGLFIAVCIVLAAWEALAAGSWISDQARFLARAVGLYQERLVVQQVTTVAIASAFGLLAVVGLQRTWHQVSGLALAGIALYAVVSLADMLSLHEVDRFLAATIGPWPVVGVLRLAGACAAAIGTAGLACKVHDANRTRRELDIR